MVDYEDSARTRAAITEMLKRTKTGYFDLLLLHSWHRDWNMVLKAWKVTEAMLQEGKLKAIGLSNVEAPHLEWLFKQDIKIKPMGAHPQVTFKPRLTSSYYCGKTVSLP